MVNDEACTILVVEDNPDHAELFRRALSDLRIPHRTQLVSNGEDALDYLLRRNRFADPEDSPRPHLILLDLRMPRRDGLEVLQILKSSDMLRKIPVVVVSTSNSESDINKAYEFKANSYFVKPYDYNNFIDTVKAVGGYWLRWNQLPSIQ